MVWNPSRGVQYRPLTVHVLVPISSAQPSSAPPPDSQPWDWRAWSAALQATGACAAVRSHLWECSLGPPATLERLASVMVEAVPSLLSLVLKTKVGSFREL